MIYNGEEKILFEDTAELNDILNKYVVILQSFQREKKPVIEDFVIAEMENRYKIKLSNDEVKELREYFETDFRDATEIEDGLKSGFYKEIKDV